MTITVEAVVPEPVLATDEITVTVLYLKRRDNAARLQMQSAVGVNLVTCSDVDVGAQGVGSEARYVLHCSGVPWQSYNTISLQDMTPVESGAMDTPNEQLLVEPKRLVVVEAYADTTLDIALASTTGSTVALLRDNYYIPANTKTAFLLNADPNTHRLKIVLVSGNMGYDIYDLSGITSPLSELTLIFNELDTAGGTIDSGDIVIDAVPIRVAEVAGSEITVESILALAPVTT